MRKRKPQLKPRLLIGQDERRDWWEDGTFKRYAKVFCFKQQWRVPQCYSYEDLFQQSYLIFLETCKRYYWAIERKHLMALYKLYLLSEFTELSYRGSFDKTAASHTDEDEEIEVEGEGQELLELRFVVANLPKELFELLQHLVTDSREILATRKYKSSKRAVPVRETTNERFCRLVGADPEKVDLATDLRRALSSSDLVGVHC